MSSTSRAALASVLLAGSLFVVAPALPAAAAAAACSSFHPINAIGVPGRDVAGARDAGAVLYRVGSSGAWRMLTQEQVGESSEAGDGFGEVVVTGDVVGNSCTDILIGVPVRTVAVVQS